MNFGELTSFEMKGEIMHELKFEVEDCKHCPCLRNNLDGEFYCFFDSGITMLYFDLDVIPDRCPLIEKNK